MTDPRRFSIRVRVYYEDTDAGGIVYHASYLRFMERARTDWLRAMGVNHGELADRDRVQFVVAEMALKFLRPARLDDLLGVSLEVTEVRRASLRLVQRVTLDPGGALLTDATVRVAVMARESGRPAPLPQWLHRKLGDS
jgi:acyl-CoA thioester hydrolase